MSREPNEAILKLVKDDWRVYYGLIEKWPQINHTTKIEVDPGSNRQVIYQQTGEPRYIPPKRVIRKGVKAWLWRKVGTITKRSKWYYHGTDYIPAKTEVDIRKDIVELDVFRWSNGLDMNYLICGYYPAKDIFIYRPQ